MTAGHQGWNFCFTQTMSHSLSGDDIAITWIVDYLEQGGRSRIQIKVNSTIGDLIKVYYTDGDCTMHHMQNTNFTTICKGSTLFHNFFRRKKFQKIFQEAQKPLIRREM